MRKKQIPRLPQVTSRSWPSLRKSSLQGLLLLLRPVYTSCYSEKVVRRFNIIFALQVHLDSRELLSQVGDCTHWYELHCYDERLEGSGYETMIHIRRQAIGRRTWRDTLEWRAGTSAYRQTRSRSLVSRWFEVVVKACVTLRCNMSCNRYISSSYICNCFLPTFLIATRRKAV